jgi:glyoxylase-like metal-dependent hydrolase (beta-lactamase superfamily II)
VIGLAAWALAGAAAAQAPAPMVKVENLRRISPHVQVITDESVPLVSNIGIINGTREVLVVDTGLGPANGKAIHELVSKLFPNYAIHIVATHAHPEHDLGASVFPRNTVMLRSTEQQADKDSDLATAKTFSERSPAVAELLKDAKFREGDFVFNKVVDIDLGSMPIRIMQLGPAHTAGDTVVWIASEGVLFSGDLAMKAQPMVTTPKATMASWTAALDQMEAWKPAIVVPSHGPIGDAGYIAGYRAYLKEVAERTQAAKAGGASVEAATETVFQAMKDRYPDRNRLASAVRTAYAS